MKLVLGADGFIGKAVYKRLSGKTVAWNRSIADLEREFALPEAQTLYLCAGRTGGVGRMASDPLSFVYTNVRIHMNVFEAAVKAGIGRVVCVGSTTGYPDTGEAVTEDQYLEGELHPAYFVPGNAHRFIKRLAMMHKELEVVFFRPSNVYGPGNNFDPQYSHVIEATVRKVAQRQNPFVIWGSGNELRDAVYIDDLAEAIVNHGEDCPPGDYNVGSGEQMSVNQIVDVLLGHAGFRPDIEHDLSKPTAIAARRVDCTKLRALGWTPKVGMAEGLKRTYDRFAQSI